MQFGLWVALEDLAVKAPAAIALLAFGMERRTDLEHLDAVGFFILAVLAAPVFETLQYQLLPIVCMRWLRVPFAWQVGVSTFLFFRAHVPAAVSSGICAGLIGGFYLAFCYAHWAKTSHWTAYWTTVLQHMVANGVAFAFSLVGGGFNEAGSWMPDWLAIVLIVGGSVAYWFHAIREDVRLFGQQLGERIVAAALRIHPGMNDSEARAILVEAGCECREDAASADDETPARLWGVASSKNSPGDTFVWIVIIDFEYGIVTQVNYRCDAITVPRPS